MKKLPGEVLNLWAVTIRGLGFSESDRKAFCWHIATKHYSERDVVRLARLRFALDWWSGHIITDVRQIGELHMIEDSPLYEEIDL